MFYFGKIILWVAVEFDDTDLEPIDVGPDPEVTRRALGSFLALPVRQRSAVILKDVLGLSLDEIADAIDGTIPAVKAALVRGRAALRAQAEPEAAAVVSSPSADDRELLARYVALFSARDWPGLRELLAADARLDLLSRARREGRAVGEYYHRYEQVPPLRAEVGQVDGRGAMLVFDPPDAVRPSYFVLLDWQDGKVATIRDYRYVRYVADEL